MSNKTRILGLGIFFLNFLSSVPELRAQSTIKIDGSSTVYPITEAVAEEFQRVDAKTRVTVGVSGTGGGFTKFCKGEIDVQNASRPIAKKEMADCKAAGIPYLELPIAYDALTIVVNAQNTWIQETSFEELKKIWGPEAKGKVTEWRQVRGEFPAQPLKLFGAASDSGTFDYFIESVVGKGKDMAKQSRSDYTANEDYNSLVQGIMKEKNSFAYIPYAYFDANKASLRALSVKGIGAKAAVLPSEATVKSGAYPLSRPIFIYVSAKSLMRTEIKAFIDFYLKNVAMLAAQVKYVPLSPEAYAMTKVSFEKAMMGTLFEGEQKVGRRLEEILKRKRAL